MLRQILQPALRSTRNNTRSYRLPADYKPPHMNDLPVPSGSWQDLHSKRQKTYNTQLAVGVISLLATIGFAKQTGLIYLNWTPPTLD